MPQFFPCVVLSLFGLSACPTLSIAQVSSQPHVPSGNPAAKASLRFVPQLSRGSSLVHLAPGVFAKLASNPNPGPGVARPIQHTLSGVNSAVSNIVGQASKIGTFTSGYWQLDGNGSETMTGQQQGTSFTYGQAGDVVEVGDWSGTGISKIGIYRNGQWYLDTKGTGVVPGSPQVILGGTNDLPIVGDWNGNGKTKVGIYNTVSGAWTLDYSGSGQFVTYATFAPAANSPGNIRVPVVGDWNGDGRTKIGWNVNGFWALDYNGNGNWDGSPTDIFAGFGGNPGETPIVGDWSNSGRDKVGFYNQGFWALDLNGNFGWDGSPTDGFGGNAGEIPILGD